MFQEILMVQSNGKSATRAVGLNIKLLAIVTDSNN